MSSGPGNRLREEATRTLAPRVSTPPEFCQYSNGGCPESFATSASVERFFLYPSSPATIAAAVEAAVVRLQARRAQASARSWKGLQIAGRVIFCEICKQMRASTIVCADVTTLNFNLLFEVGYAVALGIPVVPIRDTSFLRDNRLFDQLGSLDTLGYTDFSNSDDLSAKMEVLADPSGPLLQPAALNSGQPLYVVRSPIEVEGEVILMSALKKNWLRFRTFDYRENPLLSLHEANRQVSSSFGVVLHAIAPERSGALVHNARCALMAGLAMGHGKRLLMLQEGKNVVHPIDYRHVIRDYANPSEVRALLESLFEGTVAALQETAPIPRRPSRQLLERIELGDIAAENEIRTLSGYFVPTGSFEAARRGEARIVAGRKGTGKTAIFYRVRDAHWRRPTNLVLDLKPEGYQLVRLREQVLAHLSPGFQEHVLTALWHYLLLLELAHKVVTRDAQRFTSANPDLVSVVSRMKELYLEERLGTEQGDFSERLLLVIERVVGRFGSVGELKRSEDVARLLYGGALQALQTELGKYLRRKTEVWLLVDNLDKAWPIMGATPEDIMLLRSLLAATRKLQNELESLDVEMRSIVFIRDDIYDLLLHHTPDRGKEHVEILDWSDPESLKRMLHLRLQMNEDLPAGLEDAWSTLFCVNISGENSLGYVLARTLLRPRNLLKFVKRAIGVALNRGHDKVEQADLLQAESDHSSEMLTELQLEVGDTFPALPEVLYSFVEQPRTLTGDAISALLIKGGVPAEQVQQTRDVLLWYGFLGVCKRDGAEAYSFETHGDVKRLLAMQANEQYCIHPAFRTALSCPTS